MSGHYYRVSFFEKNSNIRSDIVIFDVSAQSAVDYIRRCYPECYVFLVYVEDRDWK